MAWPVNEQDKEELIKLGEKIKSLRQSKGLSLEQVAKRIDKDRQSIHKLEKGEFNPTYIYLKEICRGLEIDMKELF